MLEGLKGVENLGETLLAAVLPLVRNDMRVCFFSFFFFAYDGCIDRLCSPCAFARRDAAQCHPEQGRRISKNEQAAASVMLWPIGGDIGKVVIFSHTACRSLNVSVSR